MTKARFQRVAGLFERALEVDPTERPEFLARECGNDPTLRREVEALLSRDEKFVAAGDRDPIRDDVQREAAATLSDDFQLSNPKQIGPYRILGVLGEGGMGVVYHAEQDHPRRQVALKVLRPGIVTEKMLRRFEHEAELLGRLQHPGIAQIFEAGAATVEDGVPLPFFAMERIDGLPVTEFVVARELGTPERLGIFVAVCEAVHHAHQKGVIHRDLKPQNILVAELEAHSDDPSAGNQPGRAREIVAAQPKILDFGIARTLDADPRATEMKTAAGQVLGTLPYMSPEQVAGDAARVDVRSDIYSLGVLLHELLTDRLPYRLESISLPEAARVIREESPARPSSSNPRFRGDLDTIVLKALEKEPERRYASAAELAADIQRHLRDEPIAARPASRLYQIRKFAKRNRALVGGIAAVLIVLLGGIVAQERARRRAEEARQGAEMVTDYITRALAAADPEREGGKYTVRELLDDAAREVETRFGDRPAIEARVRDTMGTTYMALGDYEAAQPHLERALELRRSHGGEEDPATLETSSHLVQLFIQRGRFEDAKELGKATFETQRRLLGDAHPDTLVSLNNLASAHTQLAQYDLAQTLRAQHLELSRESLGPHHPQTLRSLNNLGLLYSEQGRANEAEPLLVEVYEVRREALGEDHPATLRSMNNLAFLYNNGGRYAEAKPLLETAIELDRRILGEEHPTTLTCTNNLAVLYSTEKRYDEAAELMERVFVIQRRTLGEGHPHTLTVMNNLASLRRRQGRLEDSLALYDDAVRLQQAHRPADHYSTGFVIRGRGLTLLQMERFADAEPAFLEAHRIIGKALGPKHPRTQKNRADLARVYDALGRPDEAAKWREVPGPAQREP